MKKSKIENTFIKALSGIKAVAHYRVEFEPDSANFENLRKDLLKLKKYKFTEFNLEEEEVKNILERGISNIVNPEYEYFTGRPHTRRTEFINAIQKFLDTIHLGKSLIIIDPYIFPKKFDSDYPAFFCAILSKSLASLRNITFVTSAGHNTKLQQKIFAEIKKHNSKIDLTLKTTSVFHDRFWLSPRNRKGIFMGTSLNGLGKKYTLINYIGDEDAKIILADLKRL